MSPNSLAWLASRGCLVLGGLLIGFAVYLWLAIVGGIGTGVVGLGLLAHTFE